MWLYHRAKGDDEESNPRLHLLSGPHEIMKGRDELSSDTITSLLSQWTESLVAGSSLNNSGLILFVHGSEQYKLWLSPISGESCLTFEDLVDHITDFILHPISQSACSTFRLEWDKEIKPTSPDVYLLSIFNLSRLRLRLR